MHDMRAPSVREHEAVFVARLRRRGAWDPDADLLRSEHRVRLHDAVRRLPDAYRRIIRCELAGIDLRACAGSLGITVNAAKLRLLRARKRLRKLIADTSAAATPPPRRT